MEKKVTNPYTTRITLEKWKRCCGVNHVGDNVVIMSHIHQPDPWMQDKPLMEYSRNMMVLFFRVWVDMELAILGNMRDPLLICIACMLSSQHLAEADAQIEKKDVLSCFWPWRHSSTQI